jgi:hypothetical protein
LWLVESFIANPFKNFIKLYFNYVQCEELIENR